MSSATLSVAEPPCVITARRPRVAILAVHHVHHAGLNLCGGAEKYLRQTVAGLLSDGASVHINYSGDSIYDDLAAAHPDRLTLERTGWLDANISGDRRLAPRLIARRAVWFARHDPDVVFVVQQAHGTAFGASIVGAMLAGCPVVASIRQLPPDDQPMTPATDRSVPGLWRWRPLLRTRIIAGCCETLIFNSRRVAELHVQHFGLSRRNIVVIPNSEPLAPAPRSRTRLDPSRFVAAARGQRIMLGALAQLSHGKGADLTLEAFAQIAATFPAAGLIYVGDGTLAQPLHQRAASLGLARRVSFAGHLTDRETAFANIDILVLPSRRESSSNAVIEAMARGLPCIVSDVGGMTELVEDGRSGMVVPAQRVDLLAGAMSRLLSDPGAARTMGDAAYLRAATCSDPATHIRTTLATILGNRQPAMHLVERKRQTPIGRMADDLNREFATSCDG